MKTEVVSIHHIFYLQLADTLPKAYFYIRQEFAENGITLVPIRFSDLREIASNKKSHVLVILQDMQSKSRFERIKRRYLEIAVKNRQIILHEVSSFSPSIDLHKGNRIKSYFHYTLPNSILKIANQISYSYANDKLNISKWPGGKRAKLPSVNM